jgi:hypothetical protein
MKVVVRFHRSAAPGLARYLQSLIPAGELRRIYYSATIHELKRRLMSARGEIPEARIAGVGEDRAYWWEFQPDFWVGYKVRDRGNWFWKRREVIVISIAESLPTQEA